MWGIVIWHGVIYDMGYNICTWGILWVIMLYAMGDYALGEPGKWLAVGSVVASGGGCDVTGGTPNVAKRQRLGDARAASTHPSVTCSLMRRCAWNHRKPHSH